MCTTVNIAVLSDIHSNYVALQTCIEYAANKGINTFIFLGDYVGDLAYPQKVMDILYALNEKYKCFFIKGNKEDYWINYETNGEQGWKEYDSTTGVLYDTYHNLKQRDLQFFKSLSHSEELNFEGLLPITICHGSPDSANEKLLPDSEKSLSLIEKDPNDIILCGHTHLQGIIEHKGKIALNPGSVGVSLHSNGRAQFMILRGMQDKWDYEFIGLKYDAEKVIADLYSSGLSEKAPYWCSVSEHLLRTGEISHGTVLTRAMALCKSKFGECNWPNVPEECWRQAVKEKVK